MKNKKYAFQHMAGLFRCYGNVFYMLGIVMQHRPGYFFNICLYQIYASIQLFFEFTYTLKVLLDLITKKAKYQDAVAYLLLMCTLILIKLVWVAWIEQVATPKNQEILLLPDMNRYGEYFATNEEYIRKYRFANAFHPFHGFSMMSCGHIAEMDTSAIYIVGAQEPGIARGMGLKTRATFEEALEDAKKKYVGDNPNILALPKTFKLSAVHLCMKDDDLSGV